MPTFSVTDNFKNPVAVPVNWRSASALFKYLKSEALHLIVAPDFMERKDQPISKITPQPATSQLKTADKFQLGGAKPEIDFTPDAEIEIQINARAGASLFEGDSSSVAAKVPADAGYVGLTLDGSFDESLSGSSGDLTFGFESSQGLSLGYWKAFPSSGPLQPTLQEAFGQVISNFTIPGDLTDLDGLALNDICTVAGTGSLKVSGGVKVKAGPNPLASVDLPLKAGKVTVQEGAMAGLSASFAITGSWQMRVRRLDSANVELSFLKKRGTTLKADFSASAGISAKVGSKDLITTLLGAIDPKTDNSALLQGGLTADEAKTLNDAIKGAIDHSLQASFDEALSRVSDDEAAFQYHIDIDVARNDPSANQAVHRALEGDLSQLTALESEMREGAVIAPGVTLISSVFSTSVKDEVSFKINLLGLLNVVSISDLLRGSKVVTDPVSHDMTITDTVTGKQIEAIAEPPKREERLRKAMFDSLLVTAAYKASGAVEAFDLTSQSFHFASNQKTNIGVMTDYLNWLMALDLITPGDKQQLLGQFHDQGPSTCLLRTAMTDAQCRSMFFDANNKPRVETYYLEFGRSALLALLNTEIGPFDKYRYALLDRHWDQALAAGPTEALAPIAGINSSMSNYQEILDQLIGDVYDITWWASGMIDAGKELQSMIAFLAGRDPATLRDDHGFAMKRASLQNKMADVVGRSKARFNEPWGMISLFQAAGSQGASAKVVTPGLTISRSQLPQKAAAAEKTLTAR